MDTVKVKKKISKMTDVWFYSHWFKCLKKNKLSFYVAIAAIHTHMWMWMSVCVRVFSFYENYTRQFNTYVYQRMDTRTVQNFTFTWPLKFVCLYFSSAEGFISFGTVYVCACAQLIIYAEIPISCACLIDSVKMFSR